VGAVVGSDEGEEGGVDFVACADAGVGVEVCTDPGAAVVFAAMTANSTKKTEPVGSLTHSFPDASTKRVRPVAGVATEAAGTGVRLNPEPWSVAGWPLVLTTTGGSAAINGVTRTKLRTTSRILIG
jgi:hypothetical protein